MLIYKNFRIKNIGTFSVVLWTTIVWILKVCDIIALPEFAFHSCTTLCTDWKLKDWLKSQYLLTLESVMTTDSKRIPLKSSWPNQWLLRFDGKTSVSPKRTLPHVWWLTKLQPSSSRAEEYLLLATFCIAFYTSLAPCDSSVS